MTDGDATIGEVVTGAIANAYRKLHDNEAGVLAGHDPEAIHQARVATRRLRSDLRTFEPFLDPRWAANLRAELHWLGGDLGEVRDVEVMRERLGDHARSRLEPAEADAVERVLHRLDADREGARATLLASMRTNRYAQLRADLEKAAVAPMLHADADAEPAPALARAVEKRWKKLKHSVQKLGPNPSADALHAVRIRAKRARYAAEACVPVFGKPAKQFARAVTDVQDVLGEHHDATVSSAWLAKTALECSPGEAYALGRLAEVERVAADDARGEFGDVWERARRKNLRAWM
jgi:CHAD domain-containing protein